MIDREEGVVRWLLPLSGLLLACLISFGLGSWTSDKHSAERADYPSYASELKNGGSIIHHVRVPCVDMMDRDESDLCAQWKAARAAEAGAAWTIRGVWVGLATLVAAIAATFFAIEANRISRRTAREQLSAHIEIDKVKFLRSKASGERSGIRVNLRNFGPTQATDLQVSWGILTCENQNIRDPAVTQTRGLPDCAGNDDVRYSINFSNDVKPAFWRSFELGTIAFLIKTRISYKTTFGENKEVEKVYRAMGGTDKFAIAAVSHDEFTAYLLRVGREEFMAKYGK